MFKFFITILLFAGIKAFAGTKVLHKNLGEENQSKLSENERRDKISECIQLSKEYIVNLKLVSYCDCKVDGGTEELCNKLSDDIDYKKACMKHYSPQSISREEEYSKYCDTVINEQNGVLFDKRIAILPPVFEDTIDYK